MRFGCPVVAADIPSLRERCGDAAAYCDPTDVSSIVGEVRRLLDDPVAWQDHQAAGLLRAAGFSWRRQVEQVIGTVVARSGAA
jgi:glycosyltransferase involved in cell wall biosynthesis